MLNSLLNESGVSCANSKLLTRKKMTRREQHFKDMNYKNTKNIKESPVKSGE